MWAETAVSSAGTTLNWTAERANEPLCDINKRPDIYIELHKNLIMAVKHVYDATINITDTWVRRNVFRNISTVQPRTNKTLFMRPALIFISFCLFVFPGNEITRRRSESKMCRSERDKCDSLMDWCSPAAFWGFGFLFFYLHDTTVL